MAILRIAKVGSNDFTALPAPNKMKVIVQDIDSANTTRTASGKMQRDRVVGGANAKRKLELEWAGMNAAQVSQILQSIGDVFIKVEYPDTYTGQIRTGVFYSGDREAEMYSYNLYGNGILWKSLKANLIEQ